MNRTVSASRTLSARRVVVGFASLALTIALATVTSVAVAQVDPISYSLDGVQWASAPPASVLSAEEATVPRPSQASSLHVRSERPEAVLVAMYTVPTRAEDRAVIDSLRVMGSRGLATPVESSPTCRVLAPQTVLDSGEQIEVPVTGVTDPRLNVAQGGTGSVDVLVAISDDATIPLLNGCPVDPVVIAMFSEQPDPLSGIAPDASVLVAIGAMAAVLAAAGAILWPVHRRKPTA